MSHSLAGLLDKERGPLLVFYRSVNSFVSSRVELVRDSLEDNFANTHLCETNIYFLSPTSHVV